MVCLAFAFLLPLNFIYFSELWNHCGVCLQVSGCIESVPVNVGSSYLRFRKREG